MGGLETRGRSALAKLSLRCTATDCGAAHTECTAWTLCAANDMHSWQHWQVRSVGVVVPLSSVKVSCGEPIFIIMGQSAGMAPIAWDVDASVAAMRSAVRSAVHPRRGSKTINRKMKTSRNTAVGQRRPRKVPYQ